VVADLAGAEAADQRDPPGLALGIENVEQADQSFGRKRWPALDADRILDAAAELDMGVIRLADLLSLELPDFFNLLPDLDFVHDFGAVETTRPSPEELDRPVTTLMQPGTFVEESSGLLRAYALMVKHNLHDLPVISEDGALVGIASRVDIGAAILSAWKSVEPSKP